MNRRQIALYVGGFIAQGILHELGHIIFGGGLMYGWQYGTSWRWGIDFCGVWLPAWGVITVNNHPAMLLAGVLFGTFVPVLYIWINEDRAAIILFIVGVLRSFCDFYYLVEWYL